MDWTPDRCSHDNTKLFLSHHTLTYVSRYIHGGYNGVDQPLPIPNREVKRTCADGTALTRVEE